MSACNLSSSTEPKLPVEIIDIIIQNLAQGDLKDCLADLKSFSLVCRSFVPACRRYIFSEVDLGVQDVTRDARQRLLCIIKEQPSISRNIHHISYTFALSGGSSYSVEPHNLDDTRQSDELRSTFLRLPNIRTLSIITSSRADYEDASPHAFGYRVLLDDYLAFGRLTTLTIQRISWLPVLQIFSSPHLSTLNIDQCGMDVSLDQQHRKSLSFNLERFQGSDISAEWLSILAHCPNLNSVDIGELYFDIGALYLQTSMPPSLPNLKAITSRGLGVEWWRWCLAAERNQEKAFKEVKTLNIVDLLENKDITNVIQLMSHLPALQTLVIEKNEVDVRIDVTSIIRVIPSLDCALKTISIKWSGNHPHELELIDALNHTLSSIKSQSSLQTLELALTIGRIPPHFSRLPFREWSQINDILVDDHPTTFPCLHRVSFNINLQCLDKNEAHLRTFLNVPLGSLLYAKRFDMRLLVSLHQELL